MKVYSSVVGRCKDYSLGLTIGVKMFGDLTFEAAPKHYKPDSSPNPDWKACAAKGRSSR
jgi:hypothetical protein